MRLEVAWLQQILLRLVNDDVSVSGGGVRLVSRLDALGGSLAATDFVKAS